MNQKKRKAPEGLSDNKSDHLKEDHSAPAEKKEVVVGLQDAAKHNLRKEYDETVNKLKLKKREVKALAKKVSEY